MSDLKPCEHIWVTSTRALGPHCADCRTLLVSFFDPTPRNTPAGALLWQMRQGWNRRAAMSEGGKDD